MQNFIFDNKTKIIFGKECELNIASEVKNYSNKILLHYGSASIKKSGLYDRIVKSLKDENIEFIELSGVKPNPRLSLVREGIDICKKENIDFILAVGGGSVIDSSKAIALGALSEFDIWEYYEGKHEVKACLPVGVVLTIPAAGSESSTSTVITNEDGFYKRSVRSIILRPKFAIMNPELTYTLPNYQTACGIADMIAHIMERYFTKEKNVELTDRLCESTLKTIINHAPKVLENPTSYESRAEIMWAGNIAHNGLLGTGRIEDWASHNIEHELSAIYDIAHGAGLSIIFPAWMKYVYETDIAKFVQFAHRVFEISINEDDLEQTAIEGIEKLESFFHSLNLPTKLSQVNIDKTNFVEMAKKATERGPIGNFVKLTKNDVLEIYKLAL